MSQTPSNQHDKDPTPPQNPSHHQIDPSQRGYCLYQFTQGVDVIAAILSVNKTVTIDHTDYEASTEHWSANGPPEKQGFSIVNTTQGGVEWGTPPELPSGFSPEGAQQTLDCGTTATWTATSSPAAGWYGTNRNGAKVGLSWVSSTLTWYISSASPPVSPTYVIDASEVSLPLTYHADAPAPDTNQTWYAASYSITTAPAPTA